MLSQRNIASNAIQGLSTINLNHSRDVIMSVFPFNHAYEFICTILDMLCKGVTIQISSGLKYVQKKEWQFRLAVKTSNLLKINRNFIKIEISKLNNTLQYTNKLTIFYLYLIFLKKQQLKRLKEILEENTEITDINTTFETNL